MRQWIASLVAVFVLLSQGVAYAHTVEFGLEHSHDGVVCDIGVLAEDEADVEPPLPAPALPAPPPARPLADTPYASPAIAARPARAPPPRGPPAPTR